MVANELDIKNKKRKTINYGKWGIIFIIPFFVAYIIFTLIPQLMTIGYSFTEYYKVTLGTYKGPNFVFLENYINLLKPTTKNVNFFTYFANVDIIKYLWNTVVIWIIGAIPQLLVALALALIFTSTRLKIKGQAFFKTLFYMPNVIMASAFALLFHQLFSDVGPVNSMLNSMGIDTIGFLKFEIPVRSLIATMNFLMWFGNTTILLMAGIQGIDESVFESARMDGASSTRVFFDITLPLLKPILIYVVITSMIGGIQMFDVPQVLTNGHGTPNYSSYTIVMYLNDLISMRNFGDAGAVSVILFIITGIFSIFVYKSMVKNDD